MKTFKEFILESPWMYHGTTKEFDALQPNRDSYMIDRAIGSHFSADPEIAKKFAEGLYSKTKQTSSLIKTKSPTRSYIIKLPQHQETDQTAISKFVAQTVFSHPEGKDLFKEWVKHNKYVDDDVAEEIHKKLSTGESVNDVRYGDAASKANTIKSYVTYFGHNPSSLKRKIVDKFLHIMKEKNVKGLSYQNTSPSELPNARSPKCYILFNPTEHEHPFYKNDIKMSNIPTEKESEENKLTSKLKSGDFWHNDIIHGKSMNHWIDSIHIPAAKIGLQKQLESSQHDGISNMRLAKLHSFWDNSFLDSVKNAFDTCLKNGNFYSPIIEAAKQENIWNPQIHIPSAIEGLTKKLKSGNYVYDDISFAKENKFYVPEIHDKYR